MKNLLLVIVAVVLCCASCKVKCDFNPRLSVAFSPYDTTIHSRIILAAYKNNNKFNQLINVTVYDTSLKTYYTSGDTTFYSLNTISGYVNYLYYPNDYIVYLSPTGKTYHLANFAYEHLSTPGSFCCWECSNGIYYTLDGVEKHIAGYAPAPHGNYENVIGIELPQ